MLSSTAEALLSLERIARFLETPEVDPLPSLGPARPVGPPVVLEDVMLSWGHGKETGMEGGEGGRGGGRETKREEDGENLGATM
jgi:hypothetical protein